MTKKVKTVSPEQEIKQIADALEARYADLFREAAQNVLGSECRYEIASPECAMPVLAFATDTIKKLSDDLRSEDMKFALTVYWVSVLGEYFRLIEENKDNLIEMASPLHDPKYGGLEDITADILIVSDQDEVVGQA